MIRALPARAEFPPLTTLILVAAALVLGPLAAAAAVVLSASNPMLPLAIAGGPLVAILLISSDKARVLWVVAGGVATLQSSQELDATKLAYLAGVAVSTGVAIVSLQQAKHRSAREFLAPILKPTLFLVAALLLSSSLSLAQGTSPTAILRDIAPFLLFALMPAVAIEASGAFTRRQLAGFFLVLGVLGAASFAVEWLDRRAVVDLPLSRLVLPSFLLPMAVFGYAISAVFHGDKRRRTWELLGALAITSILITGTRSGLIVLVVPLAVAAATLRPAAAKAGELLRLGARSVVVVALFTLALTAVGGIDLSGPIDRLTGLSGSLGGSIAGQSFRQRQAQTDAAWERFAANPIFGAGPGQNFAWETEFGPKASVNLDSPLSFPAKFGVVGTIAMAMLLAAYARLGRKARFDPAVAVPAVALLGYLAVIVAASLIVSPLEDKGVSFAMLLLLAMCLPLPNAGKPAVASVETPRAPVSPSAIAQFPQDEAAGCRNLPGVAR